LLCLDRFHAKEAGCFAMSTLVFGSSKPLRGRQILVLSR
jgi:hypothetical protein